MERTTRSQLAKYAFAGGGLALYVLALPLPIHFLGQGEFSPAESPA